MDDRAILDLAAARGPARERRHRRDRGSAVGWIRPAPSERCSSVRATSSCPDRGPPTRSRCALRTCSPAAARPRCSSIQATASTARRVRCGRRTPGSACPRAVRRPRSCFLAGIAKKRGATVIAITEKRDSTLGRMADVVLVVTRSCGRGSVRDDRDGQLARELRAVRCASASPSSSCAATRSRASARPTPAAPSGTRSPGGSPREGGVRDRCHAHRTARCPHAAGTGRRAPPRRACLRRVRIRPAALARGSGCRERAAHRRPRDLGRGRGRRPARVGLHRGGAPRDRPGRPLRPLLVLRARPVQPVRRPAPRRDHAGSRRGLRGPHRPPGAPSSTAASSIAARVG